MRIKLLATAAALTLAGQANAATLLGDTIHAYYIYPTVNNVLNDLGTFAASGGGHIYVESYQVTGTQVIITADAGGTGWGGGVSFNGLKFVDETQNPGIVGLVLNAASTANGVSQSNASFTSNSMSFNFQGQSWGGGQTAIFDIQFANAGVPEPASWAMMLAGFGLLGGALRTTRRKIAFA